MERYVCIHGHFYQPPRENAWLESVEIQDSAYPYHDWNEKITEECYAANAASRILDEQSRIVQIVNNYSRISFNFGPTLLAWLEVNAPDVYEAILEGDRQSRKLFSGHGSALAQAYNHMILPLANRRDKKTQVVWGIKDFEHRFGRRPEGMWLPETAVDLETLEILADHGISFTILAPHQAKRVRSIGEKEWREVEGGKIDPTIPYLHKLPSGRSISLFFYDGHIARDVAFKKLLDKGELLAGRLVERFDKERKLSQIVHIATDGESYGHHHRHGEMALSYVLDYIESKGLARLTNYGEYLEKFTPDHEVEIFENSSWSCPHGIERWRSDCGCSSGSQPAWHQRWRKPLREALEWLRDIVAAAYQKKLVSFLKDPWEARNDYIQIILDRSGKRIEQFLEQHAARPLKKDEKIMILRLLESQRHALLMFTSCGWFFDDISGIETVQIIQYAGRVLQLGEEIFGDAMESRFLELLERAGSNFVEHKDGRHIFEKWVKPAMLDLKKVGAHYAVSSLFEDYPEQTSIFCYTTERDDYKRSEVGRAKLVVGRAMITSEITWNFSRLTFGVLHLGDHNLYCGVLKGDMKNYQLLVQDVFQAFDKVDFQKVMRILDHYFGYCIYSLKFLFRDEQRKILDLIMEPTLNDAEMVYRRLYNFNAPMIRFLKEADIPVPKFLSTAANLVVNADLRRALEQEKLNPAVIEPFLKEAELTGTSLNADILGHTLKHRFERMAKRFFDNPVEFEFLENLNEAIMTLNTLPFYVNLFKIQNITYKIRQTAYPVILEKAEAGEEDARKWIEHFNTLCTNLSLAI
jgi:alpha-amylase/alpha-mannosidase (GH57 family)